MLTAKQHELIQFIQKRLEETGISPSFEEVIRETKARKASAYNGNFFHATFVWYFFCIKA